MPVYDLGSQLSPSQTPFLLCSLPSQTLLRHSPWAPAPVANDPDGGHLGPPGKGGQKRPEQARWAWGGSSEPGLETAPVGCVREKESLGGGSLGSSRGPRAGGVVTRRPG